MTETWRLSLGALVTKNGASFRVWAPKPQQMTLLVKSDTRTTEHAMSRTGESWRADVAGVHAGDRYAYLVDGQGPFPDPCSRSQPDGVHGWSEIVDAAVFSWRDQAWKRPPFHELVIYEMHTGTFTPGGTFASAIAEFGRLRRLGVSAIEVMPVASFPGRWNWGYDGVALFAPFAGYGGPDGFRQFVDAAHRAGLAVILDVVYNHFGPDGNYTGIYSDNYVTSAHTTPWGEAINFDGPGSDHVREFYFENLAHWVSEYHIDGFRFDATHAIFDDSAQHILSELSGRIEALTGKEQRPYLIAETHENDVRYVTPRSEGGFGFDAVWADDFHHAIRTAITGEHEGYLRGFDGSTEGVAKTIRQGFAYEGEFDAGFGGPRGTAARGAGWPQFVYCIQNHDQVGNRAYGERLHHVAGRDVVFAATLCLLLLPQTPLLFQGQEFLASTPFLYFTDHEPALGALVTEGRRAEFKAFRAFQEASTRAHIPDPQDSQTFERSKLDLDRGRYGIGALAETFHRELLRLRREDAVLSAFRRQRLPLEAAADGRALVVTMSCPAGRRRLVMNLGERADVPLSGESTVLLHTAEARFGGNGDGPTRSGDTVTMPSRSAAFFACD